jgi:hypothetical protein
MDAMNTSEVAVVVVDAVVDVVFDAFFNVIFDAVVDAVFDAVAIVAVPRTHEVIMLDIVDAEKWLAEYTRWRDIYSYRTWTVLEKYYFFEETIHRVCDEDMSMILEHKMPAAHRKCVEYYVEATRLIVQYREMREALKTEMAARVGMDRGA